MRNDKLVSAVAFYEKAFGFRSDVTRRTQDGSYSSFRFGTYGDDGFFLIRPATGSGSTRHE